MKKILIVLSLLIVSFSCLALSQKEMDEYKVQGYRRNVYRTFNSLPEEIEFYYKKKNCKKILNNLKEYEKKVRDGVFLGFLRGILNDDCGKNNLNKFPKEWMEMIAFLAETDIKYFSGFQNSDNIPFWIGYYYATGDIKISKAMREIIDSAKKQECFVLAKGNDRCPSPSEIYYASGFLERYDTDWYDVNVKNWLVEKEKIFFSENNESDN